VIVGIPGVPEVYEMQRHTIDMSVSKGITKNWSVKLGVQDILNQDTLLLQDANADGELNKETDQVMQSFNRGTYFTLTLKYRFTKK
jgi:outer membrane receptor protein involved in Fe transport